MYQIFEDNYSEEGLNLILKLAKEGKNYGIMLATNNL